MYTIDNVPELYLYNRTRSKCEGMIYPTTEFTEDVRFNGCSEIHFTVPSRFYDEIKCKWVDNKNYSKIKKNKLVYVNDNSEYFKFPVRGIGNSETYKVVKTGVTEEPLVDPYLSYNVNPHLVGFQIQQETILYDIGIDHGFIFNHLCYIGMNQKENPELDIESLTTDVEGGLYDMSGYHWSNTAKEFNPCSACSEFIPIEPSDIVSLRGYSEGYDDNVSRRFYWRMAVYQSDDVATYLGTVKGTSSTSKFMRDTGRRIYRQARINSGKNSSDPTGTFYIRFWIENPSYACSYTYSSNPEQRSYTYTLPQSDHCQIFSGLRRCIRIDNSDEDGTFCPKLRWFVITDVNEIDDGKSKKKEVICYSYEYILSDTTFSLSEDTMPFYIPPTISELVEGDDWINYYSSNADGAKVFGGQKIQTGVLNELLDYLPDWSVGYVSSELMTRYRKLDEVDNVDVYSYIMTTIQKLYQCCIVFDTENKTISAYTLDDIVNSNISNVLLTWNNSIKELEKKEVEESQVNAIRIKAGDDVYGMGVVNPTNNMLYNFSSILDELDYYPPDPNNECPQEFKRTLKEAVIAWQQAYNNYLSVWANNMDYSGRRLINSVSKEIKTKTARDVALSNYRMTATVINSLLVDDYKNGRLQYAGTTIGLANCYVPDAPFKENRIKTGYKQSTPNTNFVAKQFHDESHQQKLLDYCKTYWASDSAFKNAQGDKAVTQRQMKLMMDRLTLNYKTAQKHNLLSRTIYPISRYPDWTDYVLQHWAYNKNTFIYNNYATALTYLSAEEIKELRKHIIEGTWAYENTTFSDEYNADDIIDTLQMVLSEAKYDLENRLSVDNYDFSINLANICAIPEFKQNLNTLYLGGQCFIEISDNEIVHPMLLELHVDYKDKSNFEFVFTTDMKRKPQKYRYADLFNSLKQTSVTDNTFTFSE